MAKSPLWLAPGVVSLILFAWLLTRVDSDAAGRAYAAYGGIYICASLAWLWTVEGVDEPSPTLRQAADRALRQLDP